MQLAHTLRQKVTLPWKNPHLSWLNTIKNGQNGGFRFASYIHGISTWTPTSCILYPMASMYGIVTYIYHEKYRKNQPNVDKYTIHGWCVFSHLPKTPNLAIPSFHRSCFRVMNGILDVKLKTEGPQSMLDFDSQKKWFEMVCVYIYNMIYIYKLSTIFSILFFCFEKRLYLEIYVYIHKYIYIFPTLLKTFLWS